MEAALEEFFLAVYSDPSITLTQRKIQLTEVRIEEGQLIFTIQGLYELALDQNFIPGDQTYAQFRLNLYQGRINSRLKESGIAVKVYKSIGKINSSWYTLSSIG